MLVQIIVINECCFSEWIDGSVELGRQHQGEPDPYGCISFEGRTRIIVARYQNTGISRRNLVIEPLTDDRVRLRNVSSAVPVKVGRQMELLPGNVIEKNLPVTLEMGTIKVELKAQEELEVPKQPEEPLQESHVKQLPESIQTASYSESLSALLSSPQILKPDEELKWEKVVAWLRNAVKVLQIAATSDEFFQMASKAAVGLVGLDSARVLVFKKNDWHVEAMSTREGRASADWRASRSVLSRVRTEKKTFWQSSPELGAEVQSLVGFSSVVAAPILDVDGRVIAVLYGDRKITIKPDRKPDILTELDATLMELLAFGVGAGLSRLEQERNALAAQTRFEEFFTPGLSKRLMNDSSILRGHERPVSILFCDVRKFSQFTEQFGHRMTVSWLNDLLGVLSEVVLDRDGVLVDYSGDQVMAMWGAPEQQPDHAVRACEVALSILEQIPKINQRWSSDLNGKQIQVGLGISTGQAFVGNIGSHRKFKYGALGNVVNQASRIQNETKKYHCPILISSETLAELPAEMVEHQTRRIGKVKLRNLKDTATLHQLVPVNTEGFLRRKTLMEEFEAKLSRDHFGEAVEVIQTLLEEFPDDGPARAYRKQLSGQDAFDGVTDPDKTP